MSGQDFNEVINIPFFLIKLISIISLANGFPVFFSCYSYLGIGGFLDE
jgi:hypothetical protein